jgi:peptidoglycan hydrolase-like protein with peptidoglycan-binding domain
MQAITGALEARVRSAAVLLAAAAIVLSMLAGSAAASTAYSAQSAEPHPIPWTGWNGRPIERPHKPVDRALLSKASYPSGWSAGSVGFGSGYHTPNGSQRVREVQRRLTRLGYHTGPIDGLYGPLTRSAVQWFQIKHGLRPTGVVAATTLMGLRNPGLFTAKRGTPVGTKRPAGPPSGKTPARPVRFAPKAHGGSTAASLIPALLALVVAVLGLAIMAFMGAAQKPRRRHRAWRAARRRNVPARRDRPWPPAIVVGYLKGDSPDAIEPQAHAIKAACVEHGWQLAELVRDNGHDGKALTRPGLAYAVEQLSSGVASRLVVDRLDYLARSPNELRAVLGTFMRRGITLSALDVGLDTGTWEGQTAVRALLSGHRRSLIEN